MKRIAFTLSVPAILLLTIYNATAQDGSAACIVRDVNLSGQYKGECKDGLANGQGEATGIHKYKGAFKNGKPDGYGVSYDDDSSYYSGYFLEGLKEGKGEAHYLHKGKPDSTIKGFWSGDKFRGKKYITYDFDGGSRFDRYEINATAEPGRTISFQISTTSGSPTGVPSDFQGQPGYVLRLDELTVGNGVIIRLLNSVDTPTRTFVTYDIEQFPVILYGKLSNGDTFKLHLYKNAKWNVRFFVNK